MTNFLVGGAAASAAAAGGGATSYAGGGGTTCGATAGIHNQMKVPTCLCLDLLFHILEWTSAVWIEVPEVRPWYLHGSDLFQYHPRALDISAGEVRMVCFDLEMERCAGFARTMDALRNCIQGCLLLALDGRNQNGEP